MQPQKCWSQSLTALSQQAVLLCLLKALYYAGICSYAACIILCPKLCWHNSPRPTYMTSFSHVVGPQWMHELHQQTCCVKYTWSPTSQWYLQASPAGACLHDKLQSCGGSTMNACLQWMHELRQQYSSQNSSALPSKKVELMASCQNVFSVMHWISD